RIAAVANRAPVRVVLVVALIAALLAGCSSGSSGRPTAERFLAAWSKFDFARAAAATDNRVAAQTGLQRWKTALDVGHARFKLKSTSGSLARFSADVDLNGLGRWRYDGVLTLIKGKDTWTVSWSPSVLYPGLAPFEDLTRTRT